VPVPIGNLQDITYRAVETLRMVDVIAAEDTRNLRRLQREYAIHTPSLSYHDFNEQTRSKQIIERLRAGKKVALVSDAGTPLINDPGFKVVRAAVEAGFSVTSLPGACAAVTALVASALAVNDFRFMGFPPNTSPRRRDLFHSLKHEHYTLIFYEAPLRLVATLADLREEFGERPVCLARNLTKPDERYMRGSVGEILEQVGAEEKIFGEATLIVAGATSKERQSEVLASAKEEIRRAVERGLDTRTILDMILGAHALSRRDAYNMILEARAEFHTEEEDPA